MINLIIKCITKAIKLKYGIGVKQDKEKAANYYHLASQIGDANSMFNYARMLQIGKWTKADKELAIRFYKTAIVNGNIDAMINYAHMYLQGEGVEKNVEKAAHYFKMGMYFRDTKCMNLYAKILLNDLSLYDPNEAEKYLMLSSCLESFFWWFLCRFFAEPRKQ